MLADKLRINREMYKYFVFKLMKQETYNGFITLLFQRFLDIA